MARGKREEATVSFHYLRRSAREDNVEADPVPFTEEEFVQFCNKLIAQPDVDLSDRSVVDKIKISLEAPVEKCEMVNPRTLFGKFRALYTGHAYENTDVGEVPDSSVSLRPFFFLAYLSESGRIYIGSQYLGAFGGYTKLSRTLMRYLPNSQGRVRSFSFRHDATSYKGAEPKEVRLNFLRKPRDIDDLNKFGQYGAMAFKRTSRTDVEFENSVKTNLLAKLGQPDAVLKKAIADMLAGNELLTLRDDDIEDCTVIATVNGKRRTINVIEAGHFATRFPLGVAEYIKGHPDRNLSKVAMMKLLKEQIISKSERV